MLNMFKKISLISLSLVTLFVSNVFSQENQNVSKAYYEKTEYSSIMKEYPRSGGLHGNWPYTGFGCITEKDDYLYFVTRQQVYYFNYGNYKCGRTSILVSVIKADKTNKNIISRLDLNTRSDDTISCGIYDNTLYFVGANKNDCQNYNYDSHITLVNLNTFSHKHKYLLKNFANIPTFKYSHEEETAVSRNKYINYPYSTYLHDKYLFISFHHEYSGMWVLDLSKENLVIEHSFQPIQRITTTFFNETTDEEEEREEDVPVNFFKDILYLDERLFVISDNDNDNANINIFNIAAMNESYSNINHVETKELTDVISIRDIKLDPLNKRFYTLSGKTSSEIYRFDENMTKIVAQSSCDKDFIKIPNDVSMIYRIEIDYNTGHLYFIISHNSYFNGVATLRLVDFRLGDFQIYKFNKYNGINALAYGESKNHYQLWGNNVSYFSKEDGQLIVATNMNYYKRFVVVDLIGCSEGLGIVRTQSACVICETGKHSNEIGGTCIGCDYGYSTQKKGSLECEQCQSGLYANSIGSVSCFNCQTGYYSDLPGSTSCKACEKGKYSMVTASKTIENCRQCVSGKISQIGADDCTSCQTGKYEFNNKDCVNCPEGKFSDVAEIQGSHSCKECALGKFLDVTGATAETMCKICPIGKEGIEKAAVSDKICITCSIGTFQDNSDLSDPYCKECEDGYVSKMGASQCIPCISGKYAHNFESCLDCEIGSYSNDESLTCNACPNGFISSLNKTHCVECEMGKYAFEARKCVSCPKGKYSEEEKIISEQSCNACEIGKWNNKLGSNTEDDCSECPAGRYSDITALTNIQYCKNCEVGFYTNAFAGATECLQCPDGFISEKLSTECDECEKGKWADSRQRCVECQKGKYGDELHQILESICKNCPMGKWSDTSAATTVLTCNNCPGGRFNKNTGESNSDNCLICQAGKRAESAEGATTCIDCPDGFISDKASVSCNECRVGKWADNKQRCVDCVKGKYSEQEHQISKQSCINCPTGKWDNSLGSATVLSCKNCPSGRFNKNTGESNPDNCLHCQAGKYSEFSEGSTKCIACPDGFISIMESTACNECEKGKWADNKQRCVDCQSGKYGEQEHQISKLSCTDCPAGKWDDTLASSTILSCKNCPQGTFNKNTGESNPENCLECRVGEYSEFSEGSTKCNACPDGFISARGSTECNECEKGKWADNKHRCVDCQEGKYGDELHQIVETSCKDCPAGKWDNTLASSTIFSCKNCPAGKFNKNTGESKADNCVFCSAGQYAAVPEGASHCIECPDGFVSSIDNIRCIECDTGKWADSRQSCVKCLEGKYSDVRNIYKANQCKECGKGKWSDVVGASSEITCNDCEPGKFGNTKSQISNKTCIICQPGKYRSTDMLASEECAVCENGKYSAAGAYRCLDCDPGKYNAGTSADNHISCLICSPGKYNENYGADSEKKCKLCAEGKYSEIPGLTQESQCLECPAGKYNDKKGSRFVTDCIECPAGKIRKTPAAGSIQDCIDCNPGKFSKIGSIYCDDCNIGLYSNVPGAKKCEKCLEGTYTKVTNTITCKSCPDDASQGPNADRCICDSNTYLSGVEDDEPVCTQCNRNMICKVNTKIKDIITRRGYWRHNNSTLNIQKCRIGYACIENSIRNSSDDLCNLGHVGPLCDVCMKGWAKNGGKCFNCDKSEKSRSIAFTLMVPLICILIVIFMIRTANPTTETKEPLSGVVKIFMNYAQVFSLASSFEINWPQIIIDLFETTKEFSSPRVSFYSSDCTIGWNYYDKFLVYITLPVVFVGITSIVLVYLTKKYAKNREDVIMKRKPLKSYHKNMADYRKRHPAPKVFYKSWFYTATVIGTFLAWPTVIKQTLTIINCVNIGDSYYLSADLSVECYTTKHKTFLVIGYLSLLFYGLFVPIFGFSLVGRHRYNLFEQPSKYEGAMPLSYLFLGYREKMWYYEAIVMMKKLGLIFISVFLREIPRYQMICASLLIQFSFFLHIFLRPYDDITMYGILCNRLETLSLLALVVTLNSGLFFGTIESNYDLGAFEVVLIVLLFIMNFIVVGYFLYNMSILAIKVTKQKIKDVTKIIICSNVKELNEMEVVDYEDIQFREKLLAVIKKESLIELYDWTTKKELDNHGILLKNEYERDLFNTFFTEKKKFTHNLRSEMGTMEMNKRRNSIEGSMFGRDYINLALNKLRNKIEIIEKKRCWLAILNNRLFYELRKQIMLSKLKLSGIDSDKINDIFNIYIDNGVKYNKSMQELSSKALEGLQFVIRSSDSDLNNNPMFNNPMRQGSTNTNDDDEHENQHVDGGNGNIQLIVKDTEKSESRRSFSTNISKNVEEINNEIVTYINKTMDSMKHAVDEMII